MAEEDNSKKVGKYDLVSVIAQGNSTQIWEATDGGQSYALKVLLPERLADPEDRAVLKHEVSVIKTLEHPSFVRYRDSEITKKVAYIAMEYFRAPNIKGQIAYDQLGLHSRFPRLLEQLTLALGYMHEKGWVHRDVKPENILLNRAGEMRLIDFSLTTKFKTGLAKMFTGKLKIIQGTRTYIAPETILKQAPSPQTDMYSMGITLYEVLTGRTPFTGTSPADLLKKHVGEKPLEPSLINSNLTPDVDKFILRLLKKKPQERFANMNEVYSEIRSLKAFKVDPSELIEKEKVKDNALREDATYEQVLDSRADAARQAAGIKLAPRDKKKAPVPTPPATPAPQAKAPPAPAPQAPMPMVPGYGFPPGYYPAPQPMAGQPPYPMPQYPPGAYPPPFGFGQPAPAGYPPGVAPPGIPGPIPAPAAPPSASPSPQQPQPQGGTRPAAKGPVIKGPAAGPSPAPAPTAPPAKPAPQAPQKPKQKQGADLPLMDELPDVI